jgi:hypothetical protein
MRHHRHGHSAGANPHTREDVARLHSEGHAHNACFRGMSRNTVLERAVRVAKQQLDEEAQHGACKVIMKDGKYVDNNKMQDLSQSLPARESRVSPLQSVSPCTSPEDIQE